jgi:hypothetical protein
MAFTYAIGTDRGKVRLRLADTNSAAYAFEDDEIDYFLSAGGSIVGAVRLGLQTLLTDAARRQRAFSAPGVSYDDKGRVAALQQALKNLGGDLPTIEVLTGPAHPFDSGFTETWSS